MLAEPLLVLTNRMTGLSEGSEQAEFRENVCPPPSLSFVL